jgi:hypothetical protein
MPKASHYASYVSVLYVFTYNEGKREKKGRANIFSLWYKNIFTSPGAYGEP